MPISYVVPPRTVLICDYTKGGFLPPEMAKKRPAIVVSPRLPHRDNLCAVVPLSGTEPERPVRYVVRLEFEEELPYPFSQRVWWAKCDMIATVGFHRLDLFQTKRDFYGKRRYLHPKLTDDQFAEVIEGVKAGIGIVT